MDLNLIRIFKKIAECGSLTKASKILHLPKSKLSRDIVKLETELEQTLLIRTPRGVNLTTNGIKLLHSIKIPLEQLGAAINASKNIEEKMNGKIKITAPEDISITLLTKIISDFMIIYPDIQIELISTNSFLDFTKHQIDLALRIGKLVDSCLIQKKIMDIEVVLIASNLYAKNNNKIKSIDDLENQSLSIIKDQYGKDLIKSSLSKFIPKFSTNSMITLKEFVLQNKGIATLPMFFCEQELKKNKLVRILPNFTYLKRSLFVITPPQLYTPKHVKVFKQFIVKNLQK